MTRAQQEAVARRTSTAVAAFGLAAVTGWWMVGNHAEGLFGATAVGRLAGLLSAALMLIQVVLLARVPVVERSWGQDRLARVHRVVGFTSFDLLLAHIALVTWGYAGGLGAIVPTAWHLVATYPGMLLALAGTVCLVMVVVTSIRAARRRLRYESWHLLHLYAYLGVALALPHQLWTGQDFVGHPIATGLWWAVWGATLGAVLVWRLLVPLVRSLRHQLRVTSVVDEGQGVVSVYLAGRRLDRLRVEAGQFLNWRFLGRSGWTRANPYSLSAAPDGRSLRISVKALGDGSADLRRVRPGTRVAVEGPYGRLTERARHGRGVVLIGAGVGITPIRALAEGLDYAPGEAVLVHRYAEQPLFARELAVLERERGLRVVNSPGRRRTADSWLGAGAPALDDSRTLTHWVPDIADRDVYVCGPRPWADAVRRSARAAGVPANRIHDEAFGW
jgi:predicted ferric reductase